MPTIICSYCEYVGSGDDFDDRLADVLDHEEECQAKQAQEKPEKTEEIRCSMCGEQFNFEHQKETHMYEKHPAQFNRK